MEWSRIVHQVQSRLDAKGFSIVHPFQAKIYNQAVRNDFSLPVSGKTLVILVGNTKTLWSPFRAFYHQHQVHSLPKHPLNDYVESCLDQLEHKPSEIYWPHETQPGRLMAVQKMITVAQLGTFCPISHLCLHSKYGPWFAIRAILVYEGIEGPTVAAATAASVMATDSDSDADANIPTRNSKLEQLVQDAMHDDTAESWKKWLEVRDQIMPNHPWKYSDEQIQYHYHHQDTSMLHGILCRHAPMVD